MRTKQGYTIRESRADRIFNGVNGTLMILTLIIVLYPLYFVVIASVSDPIYVNSGTFLLWPRGFQLDGFKYVLEDTRVWIGYYNTIIYAVCGTVFGLATVLLAGYALSRKDLVFRKFFTFFFLIVMYFGGGLIPTFITVRSYGLVNTRLALILLGSVSVYHMILIRTYFSSSIPEELFEAATVDGCSNQRYFFSIALPLAKPIIAVIALYLVVGHWNSYFNALVYLNDRHLYPLQMVLREIMLSFSALSGGTVDLSDPELMAEMQKMTEIVKYGMIIIATFPMLILYPFLQKYFVKGVMVGAIKG